jgi:hypothetical protein
VPRSFRRFVVFGLLALVAAGILAAGSLPYLPLIHGTTADEVERLAAWLEVKPGTRVADLGAGDWNVHDKPRAPRWLRGPCVCDRAR